MYFLLLNDSTYFHWLKYKCGTNNADTFSDTHAEYGFLEVHF